VRTHESATSSLQSQVDTLKGRVAELTDSIQFRQTALAAADADKQRTVDARDAKQALIVNITQFELPKYPANKTQFKPQRDALIAQRAVLIAEREALAAQVAEKGAAMKVIEDDIVSM
jgi:hypothetical protein